MSENAFFPHQIFSQKNRPLTPAEVQWILSGNGGGTPDEATGPRIEKVRKIIGGMPAGKKILDIGCANGAILTPFKNQHELHGVDIAEVLVRLANANGFAAKVHDLQTPLPYADGTFDVVFSGETIEHQLDTDWFLAEINRVLKPGGHFVLTFPNIRTPLGVIMMLFFDMPPMYSARYRSGHLRDFTFRIVKIALGKHGFRLQKSAGSAFWAPKIGEFWSGLASILPSWSHTVIIDSIKIENSSYTPRDLAVDNAILVNAT